MSPLVFSLVVSLLGFSLVAGEKPLTVSLYFESYCPGCMYTFQHLLYKAWNMFKGRVLFDLVPVRFGFSPKDVVLADKLYACSVYQACGDWGTIYCGVDKLGPVMDFIYCLVQQKDQWAAASQCAKNAAVDLNGMMSCLNGPKGDELLAQYSKRTDAWHFTQMPAIVIDGVHDKAAQNDLVKEICRLRPELCHAAQVV